MKLNNPIMQMRPLRRAVLSALLLAPLAQAQAQVVPFVDYYKTNIVANTTPATNAAVTMLIGYSQLWTTGTTWDTGAPTALGQTVMDASQAYSVSVTTQRTAAEAESAYLIDRRHQSYTALEGLGELTDAFRAASGAVTTITGVAADATIGRYDDRGPGAGLTTSASVGKIVSLVNTVRGPLSSSNPSKNYFNSPRPWRLTDSSRVVVLGTETTGYYTSTLADGSPNYAGVVTFFPDYDSNVVVVPQLLPVRSVTPASDGGFVSGHSNAAYLASLSMAYAVPARFHDFVLNASHMGQDRILAGMHTTLDVIGGRMLATALSSAILSDPANATLKADAYAQGNAFIAANVTPSTDRFADAGVHSLAAHSDDKELYTSRLTYGLPLTGATGAPAVVPKGAEVLLETRLSYLDAAQRREVLRTTAIDSGNAVQDDAEGWGRLNLYAAADGYGAFDSNVTVNMDAALGGFSAKDAWNNDICGVGGLTKQGTGVLMLSGSNHYKGGTTIAGGTVLAASIKALGDGDVTVSGGTLVNYAPAMLWVDGDFEQTDGGTLDVFVGQGSDGVYRGLVGVEGKAELNGTLRVQLGQCPTSAAVYPVLVHGGKRIGKFDTLQVDAGAGCNYTYSLAYVLNTVTVVAKKR